MSSLELFLSVREGPFEWLFARGDPLLGLQLRLLLLELLFKHFFVVVSVSVGNNLGAIWSNQLLFLPKLAANLIGVHQLLLCLRNQVVAHLFICGRRVAVWAGGVA